MTFFFTRVPDKRNASIPPRPRFEKLQLESHPILFARRTGEGVDLGEELWDPGR